MNHPAFTFLICPDSQLLRQEFEARVAAFPPPQGQWERHAYWADEPPPPTFWEDLQSQGGLFGASRVLFVHQAQQWPAAVWKDISKRLAQVSPFTWPFFALEVPFEKGKAKIPAHLAKLACMEFARKQQLVWENPGLTDKTIRTHLQQRARALGLAFEPTAMNQLAQAVLPDATAIENELQKLALLCPKGQKITPAMLDSGEWYPEENAFACLRALQSGNWQGIFQEVSRSDPDQFFFSLASILDRECRTLWQLAQGEDARVPAFALNEKRQLARRMGPARLAQSMGLLAQAEHAVKSGRWAPDQALEMVLTRMAQLFRPTPLPRG